MCKKMVQTKSFFVFSLSEGQSPSPTPAWASNCLYDVQFSTTLGINDILYQRIDWNCYLSGVSTRTKEFCSSHSFQPSLLSYINGVVVVITFTFRMLSMSQEHSSEFLFFLAGSGRCCCRCCSYMPSGTNNATGFSARIGQYLVAGRIISHAAIIWVVVLLPEIIISRLFYYQTNYH